MVLRSTYVTQNVILFLLLKTGSDFRGSYGDRFSTLPCSFDILVPENIPVDEVVFTFPHNQTINITSHATSGTPIPMENSSTFSEYKYLSIVDGNKDDRFKLDSQTGDISIKGLLDGSIDPQYTLTVLLQNNLSTSYLTCIVNITLEDVDRWPPFYNETCEMRTSEPQTGYNTPFVVSFGPSKLSMNDMASEHTGKSFEGDIDNEKCMATFFLPIRESYSS
ncbi:uncharacterized protein [Ptychodera flava]|uniref:uncharacterized protein isoform X2 n=1 Tax=Ptychodera flava TaxID=63121 RepID=UPI003969CBF8